VIGHSMGGLVVQKYLETHEAAGGVLLASSPVGGALPATLRVARRHPVAFLQANLTWDLYPVVATPSLARDAFFTDGLPDDVVAEYHRRLQSESYVAYLDMLFQLPKAGRVKAAQMLVMGAEKDRIFSAREVAATAAAYGTEAIMVPGMAHDMMLEPGWQQVADKIIAWIDTRSYQ
jgi:alpha-beta hydrolase superfamily lysophospholipase